MNVSGNIAHETVRCVSAAASEVPADRFIEDFLEEMPQLDFKMKANF